jgi:hypothetical protein
MNKRIALVVIAASCIWTDSLTANAQTQHSLVTRAQVQCELQALEGAGYRPWEEDYYYPRNLQAAQARLAKQNEARGLPAEGSCGNADGSHHTDSGS